MSIRSLPWAAGKAAGAPSGVGRWVANLLAGHGRDWYAEPYAGQLGVLLQRKRASVEMVSDVDRRWYDWFMALRDHPDALAERLRATPMQSRLHFEEALEITASPEADRVVRGAATAVLAMSGWHLESFRYSCNGITEWPDVLMLADRLRTVSFWHCPAAEAIERLLAKSLRTRGDALCYMDPPYPATTNKYGWEFTTADAEALEVQAQALADNGWRVAVSCSPGGFPTLEDRWHVEDFDAPAFMGSIAPGQRRTERLVMSWAPVPTLFG